MRASRRGRPRMPQSAVAVGNVGGGRTPQRPGVRCDTELKLVLLACGGLDGIAALCCGHLFGVFQAANDHR